MYINRTIENAIEQIGKSFQCVVLYGARQVGKSTTIHHMYGRKFDYVTMDNAEHLYLAKNNPRKFIEAHPWPLVIDEIQKAPELFPEIKIQIDNARLKWLENNKKRELMYVLTGSSRFYIQQGISESLAGRCGIVEMTSLSLPEKQGIQNYKFCPDIKYLYNLVKNSQLKYLTKKEIFENIFMGGMPDIFTQNSERDTYFNAYINTYIDRDVRQLISASSELTFRNFMQILANRTAQVLNLDTISNLAGIDARTCKKWISILETSGIIYLMQPYMSNINKRIIKAPKLYFMDTGLCSYLCKWPNAEILENCAMAGAFFETHVVSELIRDAYNNMEDPKYCLYYYRDTDKKEVDILYVENNCIYPIEIKSGILPEKASKNFNVLKKYDKEIKPGLVVDNCKSLLPINDNAYYFPAYLL